MAIWQYDVTLTPTHPVDVEEVKGWISSILPSRGSWCDSLLTWGDSDGNRIDLNLDSEYPEPIVRFDLRYPSREFVRKILSMATTHGFVIKNDEDVTVQPTLEALTTDMKRSDAFRFLGDPNGFLDGLEDTLESRRD